MHFAQVSREDSMSKGTSRTYVLDGRQGFRILEATLPSLMFLEGKRRVNG